MNSGYTATKKNNEREEKEETDIDIINTFVYTI